MYFSLRIIFLVWRYLPLTENNFVTHFLRVLKMEFVNKERKMHSTFISIFSWALSIISYNCKNDRGICL